MLSLSAFSDYAPGTQGAPAEPVKTELIIAGSSHVTRLISFQNLLAKDYKSRVSLGLDKLEVSSIFLINEQLIKIAFEFASKQFFSFQYFSGFQPQKIIPQGTDDDLPHLFIG